MSFKWSSQILNGVGGFEKTGTERLVCSRIDNILMGDSIKMAACEMHTVYIEKGKLCAWLIEENKPTCDYFPINYSNWDLTTWNSDGLYLEVGDDIKESYLKKYKF